MEEDDDIQSMQETNSWFLTQLSYAKIYEQIENIELGLNDQNLATDDYVLALVRCSEHLHGAGDPFFVSSLDATIVNILSTPPTEL